MCVRIVCNKSKLGYNGVAKVDSDSLNQTGEVMMNNKIEVIQAQVDSNEKKLNAGLVGHKAELEGHKAELEGYKSQVEGNYAAVFARMDADREVTTARMDAARKVSDAKFWAKLKIMDAEREAVFARIDAERKASDERFYASLRRLEDKIDECTASIKRWMIVSAITVSTATAGIIVATMRVMGVI